MAATVALGLILRCYLGLGVHEGRHRGDWGCLVATASLVELFLNNVDVHVHKYVAEQVKKHMNFPRFVLEKQSIEK